MLLEKIIVWEGVLTLWSSNKVMKGSVHSHSHKHFSLPQKEVFMNDIAVPKVSSDANDALLSD